MARKCTIGEFYNLIRGSYTLEEMGYLQLMVAPMEIREARIERWQGRDSMGLDKPYDHEEDDAQFDWPDPPEWGGS